MKLSDLIFELKEIEKEFDSDIDVYIYADVNGEPMCSEIRDITIDESDNCAIVTERIKY